MIRWITFAFSLTLLLSTPRNAAAVDLYALTDNGHILTFDSADPTIITNDVAVTGLAASYHLEGMAFRITTQTLGAANPGVGSLWGVALNGASARFYQLNPVTGVATLIGGRFTLDQVGTPDGGWYFGFDPAADRFRLMGFTHNYLLDPNAMTIVTQTNLDGSTAINGSAFSSSSFGGTSSIYFLLQSNDGLYTSTNMAAGNFTSIGATGYDFAQPAGLTIFGAYMFMASMAGGSQQLYSVDRTTGAATPIAAISGSPGSLSIYALAIKPSGFPPAIPVSASISGKKKITTAKKTITIKGTASSEAGIKLVQYKIGKGGFKTAKGTTKWSVKTKLLPGVNKIQVQAIGRNDVKSSPATVTVVLK